MPATTPDAAAESGQVFERFHRWLRDRRLPVTRQRNLIAQVVFAGGEYLSADGVQRRLHELGHHVGKATVYRAIDLLIESGLVRAHDFGEGMRRFEPLLSPGRHGRLSCSRCGWVTEFSTQRFARALPLVADEHGFQHQAHRVEIRGLCRRCREADAAIRGRAGRLP